MSLYSETKGEVSLAGVFLRWGLILTVVGGILGFAATYMGLLKFSFFAPKIEAVRYKTFQESQSYNEGMLRDLQNLKLEYLRANPEQRAALSAIVLQRFSVYPTDRLPPDLQSFYLSITQGAQ